MVLFSFFKQKFFRKSFFQIKQKQFSFIFEVQLSQNIKFLITPLKTYFSYFSNEAVQKSFYFIFQTKLFIKAFYF